MPGCTVLSRTNGNFTIRTGISTTNEIGEMAKTMDQFADHMQAEMVTGLEKLAAGDLTFEPKPFDAQDVIGNSLAKTFEDLTRIVSEISLATSQIASGSGSGGGGGSNASAGIMAGSGCSGAGGGGGRFGSAGST